MKASMSRAEDTESLQDLGRASIQIVHDLKNQLNGLKLYATFLRRRIEKSERPDDEQETIAKLINGLDRAATDLSMIVEFGREIELKKQPGFEFAKVLRNLCSTFQETDVQVVCESDADSIQGDFDHSKLTDALKSMFAGAIKFKQKDEGAESLKVSLKASDNKAVIDTKLKVLGEASASMAQRLYANQQQGGAAGGAPGEQPAGGGNENVVDAEFEEVKDDKRKNS